MAEGPKTCLVTGASSGIGWHISKEMAGRGWRVVAVARRDKKLLKLQKELGIKNMIPVVCDVGKPEEIERASKKLKKRSIYPTMFFLNAGTGDIEDDKRFNLDLHRRTFDVNYFGTVTWLKYWLSDLKKKGGGKFIATSSIQSLRGMPGATAYGASKAAINHAFQSLDATYRKDKIRFVLVYPGPVDTDMLKSDQPLPSTWKPEKAAKYIVKKVFKGAAKIKFPFLWVVIIKLITMLPDWLYLRMFGLK